MYQHGPVEWNDGPMSAEAGSDDQNLLPPSALPEAAAGGSGDDRSHGRARGGITAPIWMLEHAQDIVTVVVGIVLILLAGTLLVSGIVDFARHVSVSMPDAAKNLLDVVLLVLILVEIVHTVVLSLQAHRLIAQPFIVVGLVAVIRRILFVLSTTKPVGAAELGLLIAMVLVFVVSLIAVNHFGERPNSGTP